MDSIAAAEGNSAAGTDRATLIYSAAAAAAETAAAAEAEAHAHGSSRSSAHCPHCTAVKSMLAQDRLFSVLALALWCICSLKTALNAPLLATHNLQSLFGAAAILGVGLAWPSAAPRSYLRWRVPALATLRFLLLALPYNFEQGIWDEVYPPAAPEGDPNPFAWVLSLSNLAVGTGNVLLVLTSLGWRLPMRVHLALQTLLVGMWVHLGTGPHCRNQLLTHREVQRSVSAVYNSGELATTLLLPKLMQPPQGPRTQAAAVLLYVWLVVGWLVPTLLLLQPLGREAAPAPRQRRAGGSWIARRVGAVRYALARLEGSLLNGLRSLLPAQPRRGGAQRQQAAQGGGHDDTMPLPIRWLALLLLLWVPCRTLAPLYAGEGAPLAASA